MSEQEIEQIEVEMEAAKEAIQNDMALTRLFGNPDFQKIIVEMYFRDEAVRLVGAKSDWEFRTEDKQIALDRQIYGIGALGTFFSKIQRAAEMAQQSLDQMETTHTEMLDEAS